MRPLEPDSEARRALGTKALEHALDYLDDLPDLPANNSWDGVFARRLDPEFAETGREADEILSYFGECVNRPGFTTTSPRFMIKPPFFVTNTDYLTELNSDC